MSCEDAATINRHEAGKRPALRLVMHGEMINISACAARAIMISVCSPDEVALTSKLNHADNGR